MREKVLYVLLASDISLNSYSVFHAINKGMNLCSCHEHACSTEILWMFAFIGFILTYTLNDQIIMHISYCVGLIMHMNDVYVSSFSFRNL